MTAPEKRSETSLIVRLGSLVKIEHTLFALPFAYVGALLARRSSDSLPGWREFVWITLAMVGARSLAMGINRLVDREIDARNPRTAGRELPSRRLTVAQVVAFCLASLALLLLAVFQLAPLVRWLWPLPVAGFVVYPFLKRATWLCHLWLGALVGLAPIAAWLALGRPISAAPLLLWLAIACWVAGFDLFYALFDLEVDREQGLHSFPARFGVSAAFWGARTLHLITVCSLALAGALAGAGALWAVGVVAVFALLAYEHLIVSPRDLRRLDTAFFTINGVIGLVFLAFALADSLT